MTRTLVDQVIALFCLVVLTPLLTVLAVAIQLDDPGPWLFTQYRVGRVGHPFRMAKLRTMRTDTKTVTRVGRVLRRSSLDELPQLWNVVAGHMALVGPRPWLPAEVQGKAPLTVRPGITGLWQIAGRKELSEAQRWALATGYVRIRTPWVDAVILLRTVPAVLRARGAY